MGALTIRFPDAKLERLKALANERNISVNCLLDEMTSLMLCELDAQARFQLREVSGRGQKGRGLALLQKAQGKST